MSRPSKKEIQHRESLKKRQQKLALNRAIRDFDKTWEREVAPIVEAAKEILIEALLHPLDREDVLATEESGIRAVLPVATEYTPGFPG